MINSIASPTNSNATLNRAGQYRQHREPQAAGPEVLLMDPLLTRRDAVGRIIVAAGGSACLVEYPEMAKAVKLANPGCIALVALGSPSSGDVLELIGGLRKRGSEVFAYEDGVGQWSVRAKSLVLMAGASEVLDSGNACFGPESRRLIRRALGAQRGKRKAEEADQALMRQHGMVGNSTAMFDLFRRTIRFANSSDLPLLITGESGTGKEVLARAIHAMDPTRQRGAFVAVNCSAINPGLVEAELFGHRRGAFTGAERDRKGLIRAAEGGVLFLDEVAELDLGLQAKLLRVLQEHSVLTVGTDQEVPVNVRFVAATNRDLERMVVERKFRTDLFHRLCALRIEIPPLRERPSDLALLILHFVRKHQAVDAKPLHGVSTDFVEALRKLDLPGNARQVENLVCEALMNHEGDGDLSLKDLPTKILRCLAESTGEGATASASIPMCGSLRHFAPEQTREFMKFILHDAGWDLARAMCECERHVLALAMERARGNQCEAARLLGITARSVYRKLNATPGPLTQMSPSSSSPKADKSVRTILSDPDKFVRSVVSC